MLVFYKYCIKIVLLNFIVSSMDIAEKTKKFRKQKGLRIIDLAKKSSLSPSYISQIERKMVFPSIAALQKIATGLGMHAADFF